MFRTLALIVLNGVGLLVVDALVPGVSYRGGPASLLVAGLVIGVINLIVKPLVKLLSLPFIIGTLGLFYLVINGLMILLAAYVLPDLSIDGCGSAILGGTVLALFNWLVRLLWRDDD